MLIIGHRGAAGLKPENTLESLRSSLEADVDMIEFDVRLTKDGVPVLLHDPILWRTHRLPHLVSRLTFEELEEKTEGSLHPITTLDIVLKEFSGQILLYLDLKDKGSAAKILPLVKKYIKKKSDWENFLFASARVKELTHVRKSSPHAQLALIHWYSYLTFLFVHRKLNLTAVGFHRLHINSFIVAAAKKLDLFIYAYTVNRPEAAKRLYEMGVDGVVTDHPSKIKAALKKLGYVK